MLDGGFPRVRTLWSPRSPPPLCCGQRDLDRTFAKVCIAFRPQVSRAAVSPRTLARSSMSLHRDHVAPPLATWIPVGKNFRDGSALDNGEPKRLPTEHCSLEWHSSNFSRQVCGHQVLDRLYGLFDQRGSFFADGKAFAGPAGRPAGLGQGMGQCIAQNVHPARISDPGSESADSRCPTGQAMVVRNRLSSSQLPDVPHGRTHRPLNVVSRQAAFARR